MDERVNPETMPENSVEFDPVPLKPLRGYTAMECIFAWLCLFAGYAFCRAFPVGENPLGGFLLIVFLFAVSTVVLKVKGITPGLLPGMAALSAVIISAALILSANGFLRFLAYSYALVIYGYYIYAATGNAIQKGFTDFIAIDFFKALLVMPFSSLGHLFKAMFSGRAGKSGKFLAKVLLGIGLAIVPTVMVLALLSYDKNFSELLTKILDLDGFDILSHLFSILFGIPVGMYLFGLYISSADGKCGETLTVEGCQNASRQMKIVPAVTVMAAVLPLLFLYVVFFVSQWSYYVSGFTGVLPQNFSYAEYAREGFFQLCAVCVINLLVLGAVITFMRRKNKGTSVLFKLIAILLSLFTLVLIATAIAKLVMYIAIYGLTPKRVYAAWFMGLLAILFVLVIVKQFALKLHAVAAAIAVFAVMFAALSLPNTDGYIAKYNVDRYVEGSLETVDVQAMEDLGLSAVPQMVRLLDILEEQGDTDVLYQETQWFLYHMHCVYFEGDASVFSWSVPYVRAKNAMAGIEEVIAEMQQSLTR